MRFSSIVDRIGGEKGADAWVVHMRGVERRRRGEDVIVLSIGEPDFATPAPIVDAAAGAMRDGRTRYTPAGGILELRTAIATHHRAAFGMAVDPEQVVVLPGGQCGLYAALMCVAEAGDEVLAPEPRYVTYDATIGASGARMTSLALRPDSGFQVDPEGLRAAVGPRTRAILINTPHNPTGTMLDEDSLDALASLCRERDLWLISDEVYARLVFDRPHRSPGTLPGMAERTVVVSSMSKSYAMTGWRLGWAIAPPQLARHMRDLASCMFFGCPEFIQVAAAHALREAEADVAGMVAVYRRRRDLVCGALAGVPGIRFQTPPAGMYVMLDVRGLGLSGQEFACGLLEAAGVTLLPGEGFGPSAAGHVRLCFAAADHELVEACARIARYVAGLRPRRSATG